MFWGEMEGVERGCRSAGRLLFCLFNRNFHAKYSVVGGLSPKSVGAAQGLRNMYWAGMEGVEAVVLQVDYYFACAIFCMVLFFFATEIVQVTLRFPYLQKQ